MDHQFLNEAQKMREKLVLWRRDLHRIPETGLCLPQTSSYIKARLEDMGIECSVSRKYSHVTAVLGEGERCFLLRSDMDALPLREESGLDFASENGCMHACGHDLHTAMLLGAAAILKAHESELSGRVKLLFQSGEEIFEGAASAIDEGVLTNPEVDAAFGMHVASTAPVGYIPYGYDPLSSAYTFRIVVKGKGTHASTPQDGISPINGAVHIYLALQELISRETAASQEAVLTIGKLWAGQASNVIPEQAVMEGTLRTFDPRQNEYLIRRIEEVSVGIAHAYRCKAVVTTKSSCPAMINDRELTDEITSYINELGGFKVRPIFHTMGAEDFAFFADRVRCCYLAIGAMYGNGYPVYTQHSPKVRFNEDAIPKGAAVYAAAAARWLEDHKK